MKSKFADSDDLPLGTIADKLYTIAEVASLTGMSVNYVRRAIDCGKLKAIDLALVDDANRAVFRISKAAILAFIGAQ